MKGSAGRLRESNAGVGVPTDNEKHSVQSVQSLFDSFRQGLAGGVENSLSTLVDDEWLRTTICTALTVHLQSAADHMAVATIDEVRSQIKQHNESNSVKLNATRVSSEVRMETQKLELTAQMAHEIAQQRERYATDAREGQEEAERLRKSLESSLMRQLASQAALQKSRKEADALKLQVSEFARVVEKLEKQGAANQGAAQELEDMKKALQAKVEAVRSIPQTQPRPPAYRGRCLHRLNRRCAGRSSQCSQR